MANDAAVQERVLGWQRTVDATFQGLQQQSGTDEYAGIQQFIYDEMVTNSRSLAVNEIWALNLLGAPGKPGAYAAWSALVRPGGPWDYKQRILDSTAGDNKYTPLPGGNGNIRYDVWSNINYGYVGMEAGFSPAELHAGSAAADIVGSNGKPDPGDEVAVQIGIELRRQYGPGELRPEYIDQAIERHRAELEQTGVISPNLK